MSFETKQIFEFGRFRLDVEEHTLELLDGTKNGTLPDKTFQTLVLLVSRPGHLVTKEDLLNGIWPDTAVEENNLDKRIHHLRKYLGEKPDGGSYIETVRGRGYRFVGNVRTVEVSGSWLPETYRTFKDEDRPSNGNGTRLSSDVTLLELNGGNSHTAVPYHAAKTSRPTPAFFRFRTVMAGFALLLLSASVIGYFSFVRGNSPKPKRWIAVLPAVPIDVSNRNDRYELGIPDAIVNRLSSIEGFFVRPTRAELAQDPVAAGHQQNVDYVIASNYQLDNGHIRVSWQLINIAEKSIEETHSFEHDTSSSFAVQDSLAADIASRLMTKFGSMISRPLPKRGTDNEQAYRSYLQGMYLSDKMGRDTLKAVESLEQAVTLDPNYAQAWAGKALAHRMVAFTKASGGEQYQKTVEAVNKALAMDPNLSEAYSAMCSNKLHYEFDFAGAEQACKKAVELDPDSSIAHRTYAILLNCRGRGAQSIEQIQMAIDLDPASYFNQRVYGNSFYFARRFDEAVVQYKRAIELDPEGSTYAYLILTLEAQGNYDEAFKWLVTSMEARKADPASIERVKAAYEASGWQGVLLERVRPVNLPDTNNFRLAGLYARLGDKDKAFEHLERAYSEHHWTVATLQVEPQLDPLRNDPRYADLVRRIHETSSGN